MSVLEKTLSKIKENAYFLIPCICIGAWALSYIIFYFRLSWDFEVFYYAGKQIQINPGELYGENPILYSPCFPFLFSISISLLPITQAYYVWYIINFISSVLLLREFNKILILLNFKQKLHRFLFLIIMANGWLIYRQFFLNQSKFFMGAIFFFIIRGRPI